MFIFNKNSVNFSSSDLDKKSTVYKLKKGEEAPSDTLINEEGEFQFFSDEAEQAYRKKNGLDENKEDLEKNITSKEEIQYNEYTPLRKNEKIPMDVAIDENNELYALSNVGEENLIKREERINKKKEKERDINFGEDSKNFFNEEARSGESQYFPANNQIPLDKSEDKNFKKNNNVEQTNELQNREEKKTKKRKINDDQDHEQDDIGNKELRKKLIKKNAFKEITDDDKAIKITNRTKNKNDLIKVHYEKNQKPIIDVAENVLVNSAKILDVKECSKGYVLKDMSGGNNSIDVSKKDNGKINYSLNKVDPDGKEPVLNLPYGAKIKLDEQGNPHLYVKKEKDFEKLKKEMGDKVLINGKNFSDVPHSLIVEQESLIKPSLESNVENKNDAIDKTIPSNVLNELKSVANNLSDIKLNNDNTQGPVNTPVGNISKKLDKHTHAF